MKKRQTFRYALCTAAVTLAMLCSASALGKLTPESAAAYKGVIDDLAGRYGSARVSNGMYLGLACARLIDFDNDGVPELYCAYGHSASGQVRQVLYTYKEGLVQLQIPDTVSNFGTDVSPSTQLYTGDGKAYLVYGNEVINGGEVRYLTKQGVQIVPALTYADAQTDEGRSCKLDGRDVTAEELEAALDKLTQGMTAFEYSYIASDSDPSATVSETLDELSTNTTLYAEPSLARLLVRERQDGVMKQGRINVAAYEINGNLYLKLRDVAAALNGTARQFAVGWDGTSSDIRINVGRHYVPIGDELGAPPTERASAERAASTILADGVRKTPTTYIIAQNHYYRLRDLADILGLKIDWDANTKTVTLEPNA